MIELIKGLYWYVKYSKRIVIPFNRQDWGLFISVIKNWSQGVPIEMQFGAYMEFHGLMTEAEWYMAKEVIEYSHALTTKKLAVFGVHPTTEVNIIRHDGDLKEFGYGSTLGWKRSYCWEPV